MDGGSVEDPRSRLSDGWSGGGLLSDRDFHKATDHTVRKSCLSDLDDEMVTSYPASEGLRLTFLHRPLWVATFETTIPWVEFRLKVEVEF